MTSNEAANLYLNEFFPQAPGMFSAGAGERWRNDPRSNPGLMPVTNDQELLFANQALAERARRVGVQGELQQKKRELQALQTVRPNAPVNLYGTPQDPREAEIQRLVTMDRAARQIGLNNAPKWDDFRRTQNLNELKYQDAVSDFNYQNQAREADLFNKQFARDLANRKFEQEKMMDGQSIAINRAKMAKTVADDAFDEAISMLDSGVPLSRVAQLFPMDELPREYRQRLLAYSQAPNFGSNVDQRNQGEAARLAEQYNQLQQQRDQFVSERDQENLAFEESLNGFNMPRWMGGGGTDSTLRDERATQLANDPLKDMLDAGFIDERFKADKGAQKLIRRNMDGSFEPIDPAARTGTVGGAVPSQSQTPISRTGGIRRATDGNLIVFDPVAARSLPPGTLFYDPNGQLRRR